ADVHRQQTEEERREQRERVAAEFGHEERSRRHMSDRFLPRVDEHDIIGYAVTEAPQQHDELAPSLPLASKVPWRLGQHVEKQRGEQERHDAADEEERAPSV